MSNANLLERYQSLVEFWAMASGPDIELAVHDLRSPSAGILEIFNGDISGRQRGGRMLPHERLTVEALVRAGEDRKLNFRGHVEKPELLIRSSVLVIYDSARSPIGAVTVNINITSFSALASYYSVLSYIPDNDAPAAESSDATLLPSLRDLIENELQSIYGAGGSEARTLTMFEKIKVIERLKEKDVFKIKGAVSEAAQQLGVSESSVYRYLKQLSR